MQDIYTRRLGCTNILILLSTGNDTTGNDTDMNICYGEMTCEEESSQWSAQVTKGSCDSPCIGCRQNEQPFVLDWLAPANSFAGTNSRFWCAGDAPSWYGGPNPLNLSYLTTGCSEGNERSFRQKTDTRDHALAYQELQL